jgi:hypothetical protein
MASDADSSGHLAFELFTAAFSTVEHGGRMRLAVLDELKRAGRADTNDRQGEM